MPCWNGTLTTVRDPALAGHCSQRAYFKVCFFLLLDFYRIRHVCKEVYLPLQYHTECCMAVNFSCDPLVHFSPCPILGTTDRYLCSLLFSRRSHLGMILHVASHSELFHFRMCVEDVSVTSLYFCVCVCVGGSVLLLAMCSVGSPGCPRSSLLPHHLECWYHSNP